MWQNAYLIAPTPFRELVIISDLAWFLTSDERREKTNRRTLTARLDKLEETKWPFGGFALLGSCQAGWVKQAKMARALRSHSRTRHEGGRLLREHAAAPSRGREPGREVSLVPCLCDRKEAHCGSSTTGLTRAQAGIGMAVANMLDWDEADKDHCHFRR